MKKTTLKCLPLLFLLFFVGATPASSEDDGIFNFGLLLIETNIQDAQYKTIITNIVEIMNKIYEDMNIQVDWYTDEDEFAKDMLEEEKFDLVYFRSSPLLQKTLASDSPYEPLVALTTFKVKEQDICFYVSRDSDYKDISDLKGARASMYDSEFEYYVIRDLIGEAPEDFFGSINTSPNGVSLIYSLAMGDADVVFIYSSNLSMLEISNPGPLKKIRELTCMPHELAMPHVPIMYSLDAPKDKVQFMWDFYKEGFKHEGMEQFKPLATQFGIKFVPVKREEFQPLMDYYQKAEENGWDKEFSRWVKTVPSQQQ